MNNLLNWGQQMNSQRMSSHSHYPHCSSFPVLLPYFPHHSGDKTPFLVLVFRSLQDHRCWLNDLLAYLTYYIFHLSKINAKWNRCFNLAPGVPNPFSDKNGSIRCWQLALHAQIPIFLKVLPKLFSNVTFIQFVYTDI